MLVDTGNRCRARLHTQRISVAFERTARSQRYVRDRGLRFVEPRSARRWASQMSNETKLTRTAPRGGASFDTKFHRAPAASEEKVRRHETVLIFND